MGVYGDMLLQSGPMRNLDCNCSEYPLITIWFCGFYNFCAKAVGVQFIM